MGRRKTTAAGPQQDLRSLAVDAPRADKGGMARNPLPPSSIALLVLAALAMLLIAIVVRIFWLSLALGVLGAATFSYAAALLHQYRRKLPDRDRNAP